jgi:hypothetical protein
MATIAARKTDSERIGRRGMVASVRRVAVAVAGLCVAGLLAASPGYAAVAHPHVASFTGPEAPCDGLSGPHGLAVNEASGQLNVLTNNTGKGYKLDAFSLTGGSYECVWQNNGSGTPEKEGFDTRYVAVDGSAGATRGRIYVSNDNEKTHEGVVDALGPAGGYLFEFNGTETPAKSMAPNGIAVNGEGTVYVLDTEHNVVDRFSTEGKYLSQISMLTYSISPSKVVHGNNPGGLALDAAGDVYVVYEEEDQEGEVTPARVVELSATGTFIRTVGTGGAKEVAVDRATGDVFVLYATRVAEYDATGSLVSQFGPPNIASGNSIAVDESSGDVYVSEGDTETGVESRVDVFGPAATAPEVTTGGASGLGETTAVVAGVVDPESGTLPASYQFEYSTSQSALEESKGSVSPSAPAGVGTGTTPVPVSASLTGLTPNRTYYYRLLGFNENANGTNGRVEGEIASFVTTGPPEVSEAFISDAGSSSVVFNALVNPSGLPTTYKVEYGTGTEYGSSTPEVTLGAQGHEGVAVAVTVSGLQPETTYHARLVASNADSIGATPGEDQAFVTFPVNTGLPDGRVYELVTPLNNHDADIYSSAWDAQDVSEHGTEAIVPFEAAASGEAVTYAGDPSPEGNGASGGGTNANQYLATRSASGWSQQDIAPPGHNEAFYDAFSSELSTGILQADEVGKESTALLEEAPAGYKMLYTRNNATGGERALFTGFEGTPPAPGTLTDQFAGASESFETLLFEASAALTPGAPSGSGVNDLYESSGGRLSLVNEKPGEAGPEPDASFGAPDNTKPGSKDGQGGSDLGAPDYSHDISADGSRVFWTGLKSHELYMSEKGAETVQVDAPNEEVGGSGGGGQFWTASADGSRVFFTDTEKLTAEANPEPAKGSEPGEPDLYEYDVEKPEGQRLSDLTVDRTAGEHADVHGVIGASEDGSYVYFVADGVLSEAANAEGEKAKPGDCQFGVPHPPGECDMYVWHEGAIEFVASLAESDGQGSIINEEFEIGDWVQGVGERTSEVTPGGGDVVFVSERRLTGYDNKGASEVYVYDAASRELSCASCDPSGERIQLSSIFRSVTPLGGVLVPSYTSNRTPRWMSDDGDRVFFDSAVPLVPEDTNGLVDVYEWERDGSGSCHTAGGCVSLLSGGKSDDNSYLLDASANGDNVFFVTRAQLLGEDQDETFNVYDARVEGAHPPAGTSCSEAGCQGVPGAPPIFATPSSVTFAGVGNFPPPAPAKPATKPKAKPLTRAQKLAQALRACRKKRKGASRTACEKQARKRYPTKTKTKRSTARKGK